VRIVAKDRRGEGSREPTGRQARGTKRGQVVIV